MSDAAAELLERRQRLALDRMGANLAGMREEIVSAGRACGDRHPFLYLAAGFGAGAALGWLADRGTDGRDRLRPVIASARAWTVARVLEGMRGVLGG